MLQMTPAKEPFARIPFAVFSYYHSKPLDCGRTFERVGTSCQAGPKKNSAIRVDGKWGFHLSIKNTPRAADLRIRIPT